MPISDGPYQDEWGDFFALVGKYRKLEFLRQWTYHSGMSLLDICEGREVWPNIRVTQAVVVDRDDPATWPDDVREQVEDDDGGWPYEWDIWMRLDKDGPVTVTAYSV